METLDHLFGNFALWSSLAADTIIAFIVLVIILSEKRLPYNDGYYKGFLTLMVIGLMGQAARSYVAVSTGVAPTDGEMAFWVFKDYALCVYAVRMLLVKLGKIKIEDEDFIKCNDAEHIELSVLRHKELKALEVAKETGDWSEYDKIVERFNDQYHKHIEANHEK